MIHFQESTESFSALHVAADLPPQGIDRLELRLVTQPPEEMQPGGFRVFRHGLVQDKRFDGQLVFEECWANSNIRDALHERPAIKRHPADVYAHLWNQLVLRFQIQRGHRHGPAPPGAWNKVAFDLEPTAEQAAGARAFP